MALSMFINFDGDCRAAVEFYAEVFQSRVENLMTYGEAPPDPNQPRNEADDGRIMYASIVIGGLPVMFMDMPGDMPLNKGDQITLTFSADTQAEVTRTFGALAAGGVVFMPLQKTFYSPWYGMVQDRFGVIWHIMQGGEAA